MAAHDGCMDIRLLYFEGCPHWELAEHRVRAALTGLGQEEAITKVLVQTPEDALRLGFIGSPTVLVDGRDPFARGDEQPALACRVFFTANGPDGAPTVDQLTEVLS